jgi:hypothetical protein
MYRGREVCNEKSTLSFMKIHQLVQKSWYGGGGGEMKHTDIII